MQLFFYITSHEESVTPILSKMMDEDIHGATIVDCEGMLSALNASSEDAPPIFGSLRELINPQRQAHKMLMVVLRDEDIPKMKDIIHGVSGSLKQPDTGILFSVPVMNWEGGSHR